MDTKAPIPDIEPGTAAPRSRRVTRVLLGIALAAFALPFLTVTCTSEPTTVSGVQAATKIDLSPNDSPGEREVTEEEPINVFVLAALLLTVAAIVLTFRNPRDGDAVVWFAAVSTILLWGFFVYGFFRTIGSVIPGLGLVAAIAVLTAASWTAVRALPRWIVAVGGAASFALFVGSFYGSDLEGSGGALFLSFYAGGVLAVLVAVAAIRATVRGEPTGGVATPNAARNMAATIAGVALLIAVGIGAPWLASALLEGDSYGASSAGSSLVATTVVLVLSVGASIAALTIGSTIVHGRRHRAAIAPVQQASA